LNRSSSIFSPPLLVDFVLFGLFVAGNNVDESTTVSGAARFFVVELLVAWSAIDFNFLDFLFLLAGRTDDGEVTG
jgi:hypothetical protein